MITPWYKFWNRHSGLVGGIIFGLIIDAIIIIIFTMIRHS